MAKQNLYRMFGLAAMAVSIVHAAPSAVTCASCHRTEAQSQPATAMGVGIELPGDQEPLIKHPKLNFDKNGYHYTIERQNGLSQYTVSDANGKLTLPIKYAFGFYNLTFVLEYQGAFYESLVTYYQDVEGLGITMGDDRIRPHNLVEAMGRKTSEGEITACFSCHGSGGVTNGKLTLDKLRPGVSCEHCHTGAAAHMEAISAGKEAPLPRKLGDMRAEETSNFCGECHRTWEAVVGQAIFGEKNVRFQPYRLANSKCFLGNDTRIRCTACHNPHADIVRQDAAYDHACLECHAGKSGSLPVAAAAAPTQKACPVADKNCVSCHMAKVPVPGTPAVFHDHDIRVVRAGEPYPN